MILQQETPSSLYCDDALNVAQGDIMLFKFNV